MKILLRTSGLVAALALAFFTMARPAFSVNGTCRTLCLIPGTHTFTSVTIQTSEELCCSSSYNPCPPGTTKSLSTFTGGGGPMFCP
jgi:hypothetical protein